MQKEEANRKGGERRGERMRKEGSEYLAVR